MQDQASKLFLKNKVNPILEKLIVELLVHKPENVTEYMIKWLKENGEKIESNVGESSPKKQKGKELYKYEDNSGSSESDDEMAEDLPDKKALANSKKEKVGRVSVSAEAYGKFHQKGQFQPKIINKNIEQINRIKERLSQAFMFSSIDDVEQKIVINAMEEKKFPAGTVVIKQGDDGENLFVVDQGELECWKQFKKNEEPKMVRTYKPGESFGELALLYNAPRAATIKASTDCVLFSLDRETFNHIVKDAASKKREMYESFLQKVDLLKDTDPYERLQVADALKSKKFKKGEYVVKEGEKGNTFFFLEDGEAMATKLTNEGKADVVYQYKPGDYFGELALLRNTPRQASVIAASDVTVAYLERNSFMRLLGPLEDILKRNFSRYEKFVN